MWFPKSKTLVCMSYWEICQGGKIHFKFQKPVQKLLLIIHNLHEGDDKWWKESNRYLKKNADFFLMMCSTCLYKTVKLVDEKDFNFICHYKMWKFRVARSLPSFYFISLISLESVPFYVLPLQHLLLRISSFRVILQFYNKRADVF